MRRTNKQESLQIMIREHFLFYLLDKWGSNQFNFNWKAIMMSKPPPPQCLIKDLNN